MFCEYLVTDVKRRSVVEVQGKVVAVEISAFIGFGFTPTWNLASVGKWQYRNVRRVCIVEFDMFWCNSIHS